MKEPDDIVVKKLESKEEWDKFVRSQPEATYCHLYNWSKVIHGAYRHRSIYLAAIDKNNTRGKQICGILPLIVFKRLSGRSRLISIPYFDFAGVLSKYKTAERMLLEKAAALMGKIRSSGIELRLEKPFDNYVPLLNGSDPSVFSEKVGLSLALKGPQQEMLKGFKSKLRNQVLKGLRNGLCWELGKQRLLDHFYSVFSRNMRDLGSPVHSKKFFKSIFSHFYRHAFICVVYYNSKPVAASFMFKFKKTLSNPWASSIKSYRHLNSNMVLYWQMIRFACNMGLDTFDMGRSSKGAPTYRFKKQWGPLETNLFWYQWSVSRLSETTYNETLSFEQWKNLPLGAANLIGPLVRRYISL